MSIQASLVAQDKPVVFVPLTRSCIGPLASPAGGLFSFKMMIRPPTLALLLLAVALSSPAQSIAKLSPAQKKLILAQQAIEKTPKRSQAYNDLAKALLERARESGDPAFLQQAAQAVEESLALEKDNYEGQRAMAAILLARHEYKRALELAKPLHKRNMDDLIVWGEMADADLALGNYAEAEKSTQWMLDLRPGDAGSLERGARLRDLVGNIEGSPELWKLAIQAVGERDNGLQAYLLVGYGSFYLSTGKLDQADKLINQALTTFPDYHLALTALAKVRMAQHRYSEAVDLLRKNAYPTLADKYLLAEALDRAGQRDEASLTYAAFERAARAVVDARDNANRELVLYYANHAAKPSEALRVARLEAARRQDIGTLDALAWALHVNGEQAEAKKLMDKVLAIGTQDAEVLAHAAEITPKSKAKAETAQ